MGKVVILDLNGVLIHKTRIWNLKYDFVKIVRNETGDIFIIRNDLDKFLNNIITKYKVGIYSSTTKKKVDFIINSIFTKEQKNSLLFILNRESTIIDIDKNDGYSTLKSLDNIIDKYNIDKKNILICDDTESKLRLIDSKNKIVVDQSKYFEKDFFVNFEKMIFDKFQCIE